MKFAPAIVVALAAAFLALAEAKPATKPIIKFDRDVIREKILDHAQAGIDLGSTFSAKYAKLSKQEGISGLDAARYALVAKLIDSVGSSRWDVIVTESVNDLTGNNFHRDLIVFMMHVRKSDRQIDGALESLLKLAAELPNDNEIAKDVQKIIEITDDNLNFLLELGQEGPGSAEVKRL